MKFKQLTDDSVDEIFTCPTEMSGDSLMFEEFIALCDEQYEYGLIEFKNGDVINKPGENDGSAKVLSYAALAGFDKDMTLKVSFMVILCQFVRWETTFSSYILPVTIGSALGAILQRRSCHP